MIPLFQIPGLGDIKIEPNRIITSLYKILGVVGQIIGRALEVFLGLAIAGGIIYWFYVRKRRYSVIIKIFQNRGGKAEYSHQEYAGFIRNKSGGADFKLMRTLQEWRKPILVQPRLHHFYKGIKDGREYIDYLRIGKDVYMPMERKLNIANEQILSLANDIDLSSTQNYLTSNYLKFRNEGIWSKYGSTIVVTGGLIIVGIFLFLTAKEVAQLPFAVSAATQKLVEAVETCRQVVK